MKTGSKSEAILDNRQKELLCILQKAGSSIEPTTFLTKIKHLFFKSRYPKSIYLTPTVFKDSILVTDLMRVYQYGFGN